MSGTRRVGFIGLGNMGVPMAANLVRGGHDVMAYDIAADRAWQFAQAHGARATESLAELGRHADVVITMLPTGREVRDALLAAQGGALAANLRAGAIVIDMSSADPVGTRALGRDLAARNIALVDAPVSGGVPRAKDATLAIMVGRQFGLDPAVMTDVINASTGRSFASESLIKQHALSGTFATGFALGLLAKDVKIAADLAQQIGVDAPMGRLVSELWSEARDAVGGNADHSRA